MLNRLYLILGKSGSGKSIYSRYIIDKYIKTNKKKYIVMIDENNSHYTEYLKDKGFFYQEYSKAHTNKVYNFKKFIEKKKRVFFEVNQLTDPEIMDFIDQISHVIMSLKNSLFVIDEGHLFFPRVGGSVELSRLYRAGRKRGIDIIMITQMVVDLNIVAIKQSNVLNSFQLTEKNELERIGKYFDNGENILPTLKVPPEVPEVLIKDLRTSKQQKIKVNNLNFSGITNLI